MPFVQGKCENCGGILAVDPSLKAAICPFCGAAYVVQDSINYYNTSIKIENMHADVVNITDESSSEARLKAAEALMRIGDYEKAEKEYKKVSEIAPQNYLGWYGLIDSHTHHYSKRIRSSRELCKLEEYAKSVLTFAPVLSGAELLREYRLYVKSEEEENNSEKKILQQEISSKEKEIEQLELDSNAILDSKANIERQISDRKGSLIPCGVYSVFLMFTGVIIVSLLIVGYLAITSGGNELVGDLIKILLVMLIISITVLVVLGSISSHNSKGIDALESKKKECINKIKDNEKTKETIRKEITAIQEKYRIYE